MHPQRDRKPCSRARVVIPLQQPRFGEEIRREEGRGLDGVDEGGAEGFLGG